MRQDYDVIVVGGGISGLLSSLVVSRHGRRVLVLEASSRLGGNCNSYVVDGFQVDTGPHAITHLVEGPLRKLFDQYFTYVPVFLDYGSYYVRTHRGLAKIPSNIKEFVAFDVLPRKDRLLLSQALTKALTLASFGVDMTRKSVYDCLPRGLSQDSLDFVDTISYFLSGKSMRETSVYRVLYGSSFVRDSADEDSLETRSQIVNRISSLGRLATNQVSQNQAYPRGGLKSLLNAVLYSLPRTVEIKVESPVARILQEDGKAVGVETKEGESYTAGTVIHSGFARDLPRLVEELPPDYLKDLEGIDQSRSLTIWLGLKEKMEEFNYIGSEVWFKEKPYWAMPISNYDPSLAPPGKQLVGFMFAINSKDIKGETRKARETILEAIPGIEDRIEMEHHQLTIPEKAAVTINGYFPSPRSPVEGLYLVGTDTDRRSMGITRASFSVLELLKVLREDGRI